MWEPIAIALFLLATIGWVSVKLFAKKGKSNQDPT